MDMGEQQDDVLRLEAERAGNKLKVTARRGAEMVHIDTLDVANANRRRQFVNGIRVKCPAANETDLDAELLRLADRTSASQNMPAPNPAELDLSSIVRPEQFYTPDVAGL